MVVADNTQHLAYAWFFAMLFLIYFVYYNLILTTALC